MTLLILLAILTPYMVIPWWAWALAWGKAIIIAWATIKQELFKRALKKQGEEFLTSATSMLQQAMLPNAVPPLTAESYGMGRKTEVN